MFMKRMQRLYGCRLPYEQEDTFIKHVHDLRARQDQAQACAQDVAHIMWSSDDPQLCATQEKGNILITRNGQSVESHALAAHLYSFSDLEVQVCFCRHFRDHGASILFYVQHALL